MVHSHVKAIKTFDDVHALSPAWHDSDSELDAVIAEAPAMMLAIRVARVERCPTYQVQTPRTTRPTHTQTKHDLVRHYVSEYQLRCWKSISKTSNQSSNGGDVHWNNERDTKYTDENQVRSNVFCGG